MIIRLKNEVNIPVITSKVKKNIDYTDDLEFAVTPDVELELEEVVRVKSNLVNQDYRIYEITSDGFEKRIFAKSVAFDCKDIVLDIPAQDTNGVSLWRFVARLNVYLQQKDTVFRVELQADNDKTVNVNAERVSLYNLLFDEEEGLCKLYDLQVKFDNRVIILLDAEPEGKNTEILFHENKNIASLDYNTNKKDLVTRLYVAATYKPSEEEKKRLREEEKARKKAEKEANKPKPKPTAPAPVKKSLDDVAYDVIMGRYGNGRPRVDKLTREGHNAKAVQRRVNELLRTGAWKNLSKSKKQEANKTETDISTQENITDSASDGVVTVEEEKDIVFYTVYTSPIANSYSRIYEGVLEFDSEEINSQEKLEKWCQDNLFNENDTRDVPLTTYSFEPAKEDYRVDLFDKAKVKYTRLGIDKVVKCVEYEYDPQNDKYIVINFGALKTNPKAEAMKGMSEKISSTRRENSELRRKLTDWEVEYERQLELDRLAFELDFATNKEKIVTSVEDGIQEAKDKAVEFGNNLRTEIEGQLEEIRSEAVKQNELNNQAIGTLNESVNEAVESLNEAKSKIDSIEIPDVEAIVDEKIKDIPKDDPTPYIDGKFAEYTADMNGWKETIKTKVDDATTASNEAKATAESVSQSLSNVISKFNADGSLKEFKTFKNTYEQTAKETKQTLENVKRYVDADGTRRSEINTYIANKSAEVFTEEFNKVKSGYVAKSTLTQDVRGVMQEYTEKVDNLKLGTRNYILDSNECTAEKQKNYKLATDDWSIFRGKTVIVSVDVETINASGSYRDRTRTGFELAINLADGTTFYGAQIFTSNPNFKGRISRKVTIPDKEITRIQSYVQNEWANGFSQTCRPMLEIANVESDYQPAHEDMSDKIAKYQEGVDRKLSELTDTTNDNKTAISKVVQTAKEISSQITFDSNGNVKFREVKLNNEGNVISTKDKLLDDTTIANTFKQDSEGTRILTERVLSDGRKVADSIVNTGSGINLISDRVRVTSSNENLVSSELLNVTTRRRGRMRLTPIFENKGDYKLSSTDQFIFKARAKNNSGSSDLNPQLVTIDSSGQESWQHLSSMFRSSNKDFTNVIYEGNLNDKNIANATKYYFAFWADDSTEYEYEDLSIVKKKDASFIVDGSIKGKHLDMDSARIGILTTGVILNKHLDTNSVTSDKMKVDEAMIEKLLTNVHVTNKLWANEAFVNKVNSIEISANRIKTGWLESKNRWLAIGMENGSTWYRGDATINFESSNNVFQRSRGGTTAFLKFQDDSYGGAYTTLGVNADGDRKLKPNEDYSGGTFAGIRIIRQYKKGDNYSRNLIDKVQLVADRVAFAPEQKNATEFLHIDYWEFKDLKINAPIKLIKFLKKVSEYTKISLTSP